MSLAKTLLGMFVKKSTGRSINDIDKLSSSKRAKLARDLRDNVKSGKSNLSGRIQNILKKDMYNKPLSSSEREMLNFYEKMTDNPNESVEWLNIKSRSGNFIKAGYYKASKRCVVHMRRGKGYYTFYRVPRTKWLALCDVGGRYMWDWFGQKYSTNPRHWIRSSLMVRYSTRNYTNTKRFKNKRR